MNRKILRITALILTIVLALAICMTGCSKSKKLAGDLGTLKDDVAANKADATKALSEATKALEDKIKAQDTNCATEISAVEKALEAVKNDSDEADAAIKAALEAVRSALNESTKAIESRIEANNTDLSAQISSLSAAINVVEANGNAADSDIKAAQQALSNALDAVSADLASAKTELSNKITENAASASKEIASLNTAILAANKNLEAAKKAIEETHNADIAALSSKLESASKTLADAISDNSKAIEKLDSELKALRDEVENKLSANEAYDKAEIESLNALITQVKSDFASADSKLQGDYNTKLAELFNTVSGIDANLAGYIAKNDAIIEGLKGDIEGINETLDALNDATKTLNDALNSKIDTKADDLSAEIKALGEALVKAEEAATNANDELKAELMAAIDGAVEAARSALQASIDEINRKILINETGFADQIKGLAAAIKICNDSDVDIRGAIDALASRLVALENDINGVISEDETENIVGIKTKIEYLKANIEAVEDAFEDADAKLQAQIGDLMATVEEISGNLDEHMIAYEAKIQGIEAELARIAEDIEDKYNNLDDKINAEKKAVVEALNKRIADLNALIGDVEGEESLQEQIINLKAMVTEISEKLDEFMTEYEAKIQGIEDEIARIAEEIAQNYADLDDKIGAEKTAVVEALNKRIADLNALIGEVEGEDSLQAQITAIKGLITTLQDSINDKEVAYKKATEEGLKAYLDVTKLYKNVSDLYDLGDGDNSKLEEAYLTASYKLMRVQSTDEVTTILGEFNGKVEEIIKALNATYNEIYGYIVNVNDYVADGKFDLARDELLNKAVKVYIDNFGYNKDVKYVKDDGTFEVVDLYKELENAVATYGTKRYEAIGEAIANINGDLNAVNVHANLASIKEAIDAQGVILKQLADDGFDVYDKDDEVATAYNDLLNAYNQKYVKLKTNELNNALNNYYGNLNAILSDIAGKATYSTVTAESTIADIRAEYDAFISSDEYNRIKDELGGEHELIVALEQTFSGKLASVESDRDALEDLCDKASKVAEILDALPPVLSGTKTEYDTIKAYEQALEDWTTEYETFLKNRADVYGESDDNAAGKEALVGYTGKSEYEDIYKFDKEDSSNNLACLLNSAKNIWDNNLKGILADDDFDANKIASYESIQAAIKSIEDLRETFKVDGDPDGISFIFQEIVGYNGNTYDSLDNAEADVKAVEATNNAYIEAAEAAWAGVYSERVQDIIAGNVAGNDVWNIYDKRALDNVIAWYETYDAVSNEYAEKYKLNVGTTETKGTVEGIVSDVDGLIGLVDGMVSIVNRKIGERVNDLPLNLGKEQLGAKYKELIDDYNEWSSYVDLNATEENKYILDKTSKDITAVEVDKYNELVANYKAFVKNAQDDWANVYTDRVQALVGGADVDKYDLRAIKGALAWFGTYGRVDAETAKAQEYGNVGTTETEETLKKLVEAIEATVTEINTKATSAANAINGLSNKIVLADKASVEAARELYDAWVAYVDLENADNEYIGLTIVDATKLVAAEKTIKALEDTLEDIKSELEDYKGDNEANIPSVGTDTSKPYFASNEEYLAYKAEVESLKAMMNALAEGDVSLDEEYLATYNEMCFVLERYDACMDIQEYYNIALMFTTDETKLDGLKQVYEKWILNVIPDVKVGESDVLDEAIEGARKAIDAICTEMIGTVIDSSATGGDNFGIYYNDGQKHTVNTGVIMSGVYGSSDSVRALFADGNGTNVTIAGGLFAGGSGAPGNKSVMADHGAIVTIDNGWFTVGADDTGVGNSVIYADNDATIYIKGGVYRTDVAYKGVYYVLNVKNGSNAQIIVSGGRFYKFNPALAAKEGSAYYVGDGNVSVAKGYHVIQDGDWFEVVADINGEMFTKGDNTIDTTIKMDGTYDQDDIVRAIYAVGNGTTLTINGGNYYGGSGAKGNVAVGATSGANVTIAGGCFTVGGDDKDEGNSVIYADGDAVITITGGEFRTNVDYKGKYYVLNCKDGSDAKIIVKGGRYYKFNPAEASVEGSSYYVGSSEIYVAEGYEVVQVDDWFYVVPTNQTYNGMTVANGESTTLTKSDSVTMDGVYSTTDKVKAIWADGKGTTLTINGGTYNGGSGAKGNVALKATDGAQVTIAGGYFTVGADCDGKGNAVIEANDDAVITITGGEFRTDVAYNGVYFVLNCNDKSSAQIIVMGGRFYKFNPALASVKGSGHYTGEGEVVVAKGCHVVQDGEWFEVVKDTENGNGIEYTSGSETLDTTIQMSDSYVKGDLIRAILAEGLGTNLTIEGGYYNGGAGGSGNVALKARNSAIVTIKGGYFTVGADCNGKGNALIEADTGATIIITGGEFRTDYTFNGKYYVLNCNDNTGSKIIVKGGRYYKFNPALASVKGSEYYIGANEVYVAAGYHVIQDGDWFEVVTDTPNGNGQECTSGSTTLNTTIQMSDSYVEGDRVRAILADGADTTLTIEGGYYNGGAGGTGNVALKARNGANVTIAGGYFTVGADCDGEGNALIEADTGATIIITGGEFRTDVDYNGVYYVLNCKNGSDAKIIVSGGRFYKFDPSRCGDSTSPYYVGDSNVHIAEGYHVVQDGDWFEVVAD